MTTSEVSGFSSDPRVWMNHLVGSLPLALVEAAWTPAAVPSLPVSSGAWYESWFRESVRESRAYKEHGVIVITAAALAQDVVGVAIANFGDAAVGASIPVVTCPFLISRQC